MAVQADLLGPDRRTVLASAFTPVRRMAIRTPLVVRLEGPPRIEVLSDPKAATTVFEDQRCKVERSEGLTGDVARRPHRACRPPRDAGGPA